MMKSIIEALAGGRELRLSVIAARIGCSRGETASYLHDLQRWGMATTIRQRSPYWRLTTWLEKDAAEMAAAREASPKQST